MSEKLKPCPFCGKEPTLSKEGKINIDYHIYCKNCGVVTRRMISLHEAITAWNTRYYESDEYKQKIIERF